MFLLPPSIYIIYLCIFKQISWFPRTNFWSVVDRQSVCHLYKCLNQLGGKERLWRGTLQPGVVRSDVLCPGLFDIMTADIIWLQHREFLMLFLLARLHPPPGVWYPVSTLCTVCHNLHLMSAKVAKMKIDILPPGLKQGCWDTQHNKHDNQHFIFTNVLVVLELLLRILNQFLINTRSLFENVLDNMQE